MKNRNAKNSANQSGFTLMESMIVLFIIAVVSAITVSRLYTGKSEVGGGERILDEAAARITERRSDAVRLHGEDRQSRLRQFQAAPLPIDFSNLSLTGSLRIDGADDNADCVDDFTGQPLTCLKISNGHGEWDLALNGDGLKLPAGWRVYTGVNRRSSPIPPFIAGAENGRGIPATAIGFDASGKALAKEVGSGEWVRMPSGSVASETPSKNEAPFWAIYFFVFDQEGIRARGSVTATVAVAVHPSGLVEKFRYDDKDGVWIGFQNRVVK